MAFADVWTTTDGRRNRTRADARGTVTQRGLAVGRRRRNLQRGLEMEADAEVHEGLGAKSNFCETIDTPAASTYTNRNDRPTRKHRLELCLLTNLSVPFVHKTHRNTRIELNVLTIDVGKEELHHEGGRMVGVLYHSCRVGIIRVRCIFKSFIRETTTNCEPLEDVVVVTDSIAAKGALITSINIYHTPERARAQINSNRRWAILPTPFIIDFRG